MSGSGGGGGGGGGGGAPEPTIDCSRLIIRTTINSPDPKVIKKIRKDDKLDVESQGERGPVVVKTRAGEVAGSITSKELLALIKCIADGNRYVAIVRDVSGGKVEVEIRPESA